MATAALVLLALATSAQQQQEHQWDPAADPAAVVTFGGARFTVLSDRLIRMETSAASDSRGGGSYDDRATAVVVNRRFPAVPSFTVTHPNASAVTISTKALRLTYAAHVEGPAMMPAPSDSCGCSVATAGTCTDAAHNITWALRNHSQGGDGTRTPGCPNGLSGQTLDSCFCACVQDPDCEGITYAPPHADLGKSCWLLMDVSKVMAAGDRVLSSCFFFHRHFCEFQEKHVEFTRMAGAISIETSRKFIT